MEKGEKVRRILLTVLLAAVYFGAGKLGLSLAFVHASASAVWPPTGIAIAALLILGYGAWPAIFVGAFLVNVTTAGSIATSLGIATGNTLEGLVGSYLVNRFAHGRRAFERAPDVFKFVVLAGLVSTVVSATVGVATLSLGGFAAWNDFGVIWLTWWLGDVVGALIVAPLLILWAESRSSSLPRRSGWEIGALFALLLASGFFLFTTIIPEAVRTHPLAFLLIPIVVWIAYRLGSRYAAMASVLLSGIAIGGTLNGAGPFVRASPNESLLLLQAFMGVLSVLGLSLGATVRERTRAETLLREERDALEQRVLDRTASLTKALEDLKHEMSQRHLTEASVSKLASVVQSSYDPIIVMSPEGTITDWNPAAEALYGYRASEAVGRSLSMLMPPNRVGEWKSNIVKLRNGEPIRELETERLRKDGKVIPVSLTLSPVYDVNGGLIAFSAIVRDISERKRAEAIRIELAREQAAHAESQHEEERAQFLADASRALSSSLNYSDSLQTLARLCVPRLADWCIIHMVNDEGTPQVLSMAHKDPEKVAWARELQKRYPPDLNATRGPVRVIQTGKPELYQEISDDALAASARDAEHLRILKSLGFKSAMVVPLTARGQTLGALTLVSAEQGIHYGFADLSLAQELAARAALAVVNARLFEEARRELEARRRVEQELQQLNVALEERIRERTKEIEASKRELEAFVYTASHDLQTPLRTIDGFSHVLLEESSHRLDEEGRGYLQRIRRAAQHMAGLITDLLNFSRVSRTELHQEPVDLTELAQTITASLEERDPKRQVTFMIQDHVMGKGDARLLRVVLENLLGNAWKFTSKHAQARIEFGTLQQKGETVYFVRDDGAGFDMELAKKLFHPFERLHSPGQFEGTGIGLASVQRILERHGGRVWADAATEKGATFYFTLGSRKQEPDGHGKTEDLDRRGQSRRRGTDSPRPKESAAAV